MDRHAPVQAEGSVVIDVRAKPPISPTVSIRWNDERLSAINRKSRSFSRLTAYNAHFHNDGFSREIHRVYE